MSTSSGPSVLALTLTTTTLTTTNNGANNNKNKDNNKLLILGLGRVGLEIAQQALPHFSTVVGTVRRQQQQQRQRQRQRQQSDILHDVEKESENDNRTTSIQRIPFEMDLIRPLLAESTHVLLTIPLPKERDATLEAVLHELQQQQQDDDLNLDLDLDDDYDDDDDQQDQSTATSKSQRKKWVGMLSTTGVYGNYNGDWVTEESELRCSPNSNADLYRQLEVKMAQTVDANIFRCAGIYDSTRSALHTVYKKGFSPPTNDSQAKSSSSGITNRIHSVDIAKAVVASMMMQQQHPNNKQDCGIYNLADDCPAPRMEVMQYAADLLQEAGVTLPSSAASRSSSSSTASRSSTVRERRRQTELKLVANGRLRQELLLPPDDDLTYSSYREGLQAILQDPSTPWYDEMKQQ